MKERPILFNAAMVNAILDGRKTQTRRIIKNVDRRNWIKTPKGHPGCHVVHGLKYCPYGEVGDQLWVREIHYYDIPLVNMKTQPENYDPRDMYYRANGECCQQIPECQCFDVGKPKWRPSIFMPRWASRIQLEITDVRVELLNNISDEDVKAEGTYTLQSTDFPTKPFYRSLMEPKILFEILWDSINAKKHPWESNPWVWVVEFKQVAVPDTEEGD